jgi:glucose/arabinose dehydrogenase
MSMNRRRFLAQSSTVITVALSGCIGKNWGGTGNTTSPNSSDLTVKLDTIAEEFNQPLALADVPSHDLKYIADKMGTIHVMDEGNGQNKLLLDITDRMVEISHWEQGLLGLALHPNFEDNGKYYVRYSAPPREDTPPDFSHTFVLSEFEASTDRTETIQDSEQIILEIPQPGKFHQAGGIAFGPDNYLYVAVGDGGANNEAVFAGFRDVGPGHAEDWYTLNRGGNGQDVSQNLLGSILRIDVDGAESGNQYAIPDDNPLVGTEGLNEHYAWGFRNPYRISFDRDRLFVGDVGFADYEEINLVEKGGNYGWNVREGPRCVNANTAVNNGFKDDVPETIGPLFKKPPLILLNYIASKFTLDDLPICPRSTPKGKSLTDPLIVYPHRQDGEQFGQAVIGGYVYRGSDVENLEGRYIFGDLTDGKSGRLFASNPDGSNTPRMIQELKVADSKSGKLNESILSFGRDEEGELYILTTSFSEGSGKVYRIFDVD